MSWILPAEHVGTAKNSADGWLTIGPPDDPNGQVRINLNRAGERTGVGWWSSGDVDVYVRRDSLDLSVIEVHMVRHDGNAQEELDEKNRQAETYPLGPKEYWRGEMVGKYLYGSDQHPMTDEEFERDWADEEGALD